MKNTIKILILSAILLTLGCVNKEERVVVDCRTVAEAQILLAEEVVFKDEEVIFGTFEPKTGTTNFAYSAKIETKFENTNITYTRYVIILGEIYANQVSIVYSKTYFNPFGIIEWMNFKTKCKKELDTMRGFESWPIRPDEQGQ